MTVWWVLLELTHPSAKTRVRARVRVRVRAPISAIRVRAPISAGKRWLGLV